MGAEILINKTLRETRVARLESGNLVEVSIERENARGYVGNIYIGKVSRVLPGMQAAFIDLGLPKSGFLYVKNVLSPENEVNTLETIEEDPSTASIESDADDEGSVLNTGPVYSEKKISELLHEGEKILVQVIKNPMGTKGPRLSGFLSIPGRMLVYLPDSKQIGVSRRIEDQDERNRLKTIVEKNRPSQGGFIIRTVAIGATEKHIKDDMEYLLKLWSAVKKGAEKVTQPGLVYTDLDLQLRIIRDRVTEDVDRIVIDDLAAFKQMTKFVQSFLPKFKKRIEYYQDKTSLFHHHGIESELNRAISRKVWLKSGGYIVIDETEALTTIDVNTGRFVGRRNLEETIFQTNNEAVREIAYQIRLRNLGGIIVLDFIDMDKPEHKDSIFQSLQEELKKDPVKTNVLPISPLGLIEMTRKRTQKSLRQQLTSPCDYCDGKGYLKSTETIALDIFRNCEKEGTLFPDSKTLTVYCHPDLAEIFTEEDRSLVEELEKKLTKKLVIKVDPTLHLEDYEVLAGEA